MLRKSIGFCLIALFMKSTSAMIVHHGVILEDNEWTTGTAIIQAQERPRSHKAFKAWGHQSLHKDQEGVLLRNRLDQEVEGMVGRITEIGGTLEAYVENFTAMVQTYKISSNFCVTTNQDTRNNPCHYRSYRVELDPYGWFLLDVIRVFSYEFPEAGVFGTGFFMTVEKEGGTSTAVTYDLASINIEALEE